VRDVTLVPAGNTTTVRRADGTDTIKTNPWDLAFDLIVESDGKRVLAGGF
jgi:hypothetical protein